jgi:hypothetical protein
MEKVKKGREAVNDEGQMALPGCPAIVVEAPTARNVLRSVFHRMLLAHVIPPCPEANFFRSEIILLEPGGKTQSRCT